MQSLNEQITTTLNKQRLYSKWSSQVERLNQLLMKSQVKHRELHAWLQQQDIGDIETLHTKTAAEFLMEDQGSSEAIRDKIFNKFLFQELIRQSEELEREKGMYEEHAAKLGSVEEEVNLLMERKEDLISRQNTIWSRELYEVTKEEVELNGMLQDVSEAVDAGKYACHSLAAVLKTAEKLPEKPAAEEGLDSLLMEIEEKSRLEEGKELVHQASRRLRQFFNELEELEAENTLELSDSFRTEAEEFYFSFFEHWVRRMNLQEAVTETLKIQERVESLLHQLKEKRSELEDKRKQASLKRIELIGQA